LKLIFGKECIADCAPSFELVRRRKYSERAIVTATVAVKIAWRLFLWQSRRKNSQLAIFTARLFVVWAVVLQSFLVFNVMVHCVDSS